MKRIFDFFSSHRLVVSLLLMMVAILTSGAGVCMAEAAVGDPDPANPDPVNPATNDMGDSTGNGAGQNLPSTQGSATQMRRGDLAADEYDPDVVKYNAPKYVLLNLARTVAVQRNVKGYEIDHYRVGKANLKLQTTAAIAEAEKITLTSSNCNGNLNMLGVAKTVIVKGVKGFIDGSQTKRSGDLVLIVMKNDEDGVVLRPLNGKAKVAGKHSDYLQDYLCPAIPANTTLNISSYAGSESQKIVDPDNSQPRPDTVFLQKRLFNIVITDHEREILKKTPWGFDEMRDQALDNFSDQFETDLWNGVQRRWLVKIKGGNEEYAYSSEGILRQLTNTLGIDGKFKYVHITAIGKILFTKFAETTEAYLLCGKNKIGEIANMEEIRKQMEAPYSHKKTDYGVVVRDLVSNFGTLHIVYAPKMDELGYEDFCVAVPLQIARYYHKIKKEGSIDLNKAGDEAREAMRYTYIEIAALALRGQNSLLIGPSNKIVEMNLSENANPVTWLDDELPVNPYNGMIVAFENDMEYNNGTTTVTLSKEKAWQWNGTTWVEFTGTV
jgi:hypothetical protein